MKRWALCDFIDDPNDPGSTIPRIYLYTGKIAIVGDSSTHDWVLVRFATDSLGPINADPNIIVFPDITRDAQVNTLPPGLWNALKARAEAVGFNIAGINTSDSFGTAVTHIGQQIEPGFVDTDVDVRE